MAFVVNPWEVSGDIDYEKLISDFGLKPFRKTPPVFQDVLLFRRGLVFAHRDFAPIAKAIEDHKPFAMMTGLMPSGKFHFGHKLVADQIIAYQKAGARVFLAVADIEAYNARGTSLKESRSVAVDEYLANYIALGINMDKTDFYFQSARSKDSLRSNAYYRLSGLFARHSTFNEFRGVYGDITPGKMASSLLQAADMYHPQLPEFGLGRVPTVVPVGVDQDPHLRLARGIARRFDDKLLPISSTYHSFLPGLKGGKMSSSDPFSFVALSDNSKDAARKIMKYAVSGGRASVEEHRRLGGDPSVDVAFQMLLYGLEPSDAKLGRVADDYRSGSLLTGELKQLVVDRLSSFLDAHSSKLDNASRIAREMTR